MSIALEIVTPVKKILSVKADAVKIPGFKGELGVLNEHASLVSTIESGLVYFTTPEGQNTIAVRGGFAEIQATKVLLLVDEALTKAGFQRADLESKLKTIQDKLVASEVGFDDRAGLFKERDWLVACLAL